MGDADLFLFPTDEVPEGVWKPPDVRDDTKMEGFWEVVPPREGESAP